MNRPIKTDTFNSRDVVDMTVCNGNSSIKPTIQTTVVGIRQVAWLLALTGHAFVDLSRIAWIGDITYPNLVLN